MKQPNFTQHRKMRELILATQKVCKLYKQIFGKEETVYLQINTNGAFELSMGSELKAKKYFGNLHFGPTKVIGEGEAHAFKVYMAKVGNLNVTYFGDIYDDRPKSKKEEEL